MQARWTVYLHVLDSDGRSYVGLTKKTVMRRWNQHVLKSRKPGHSHFWNAIRKHGKEAFSHHAIMVLDSVEDGNAWEKFWIEFLDLRDPRYGFNLAPGGSHIPHPKRNPWDRPEFREKMTAQLKSMHANPVFVARNKAASVAVSRSPEFRAKFMDPRLRAMRSEDSMAYWASKEASIVPAGSKLCSACGHPGVFAPSPHRKGELVGVCNACVRARRDAQKADLRSLIEKAKDAPCSVCGGRFTQSEVDLFRAGRKKTISWMVHQLCAREGVLREIAKSAVMCFACLPSATT